METQERICGLCSKICDNPKAIDGDMKEVLDVVLPKIDLAVIQKLAICTNCAEILTKCFDFKAACFYTHDFLFPLVNKEDVKLDLKDAFLRKNKNSTGVPEDQAICAFCMDQVKNCCAISLDVKEGDILKKMIKQCLPELNLSIIKKPVICPPCHCSLEDCFRFVTKYLILEATIKKDCETLDIERKVQSTTRDLAVNEVDGDLVDTIKIENQYYENSEDVKDDVEHEIKSFMDADDLKFENENQFTPENMFACKEESNNPDIIKTEEMLYEEEEFKEKRIQRENLAEMEDQKFLFNDEIEIKTEEQDFSRCEGAVGDLSKPHVKHTMTNENAMKIRMFYCDFCPFQAKVKTSLKIHLLKHKDPYDVTKYICDSCSYETQWKAYLKRHLLVHKQPSEVTTYKCDSCSFQTKRKASLTTHLLVHKSPSDITMYKCDLCSFQAKQKCGLISHLLVHKNLSEVTMYKCDSCSYQSKLKGGLTKHLLVHKTPSEVTMYKCYSCSFQTKLKSSLGKHLLLHKSPSDVTIYKCDSCSYSTKLKGNLTRHLLVHKRPKIYKCDSCLYQSKRKAILTKHLLVHEGLSEVKMYKCKSCSFQSKKKHNLTKHLLVHATVHKCESCLYQTKHKGSLTKHLLIHKHPSELTMYKCDLCSYQAKLKTSLTKHLLRHNTAVLKHCT